MVLIGHKNTATNIKGVGASFNGWSSVGLNMSGGLAGFSDVLHNVHDNFVDLTSMVMEVDEAMDDILALIGKKVDELVSTKTDDSASQSGRVSVAAMSRIAGQWKQDMQSLMQVALSVSDNLHVDEAGSPRQEAWTVVKPPSQHRQHKATFTEATQGATVCPSGFTTLVSKVECDTARIALGIPKFNGESFNAHKDRLPYCWIGNHGSANWNGNGDSGPKHDASTLICKKEATTVATTTPLPTTTKAALVSPGLEGQITELMQFFMDKLKQLWDLLAPLIDKIKNIVDNFSDKMLEIIKKFSSVVTLVQNIFDQILSAFEKASSGETDIEFEAFNLFDMSNTGLITLEDIQMVSQMYEIAALTGPKAATLLAQYDDDADKMLDPTEFANFAQDQSLPNIMPDILRTFANKLASLSGPLKRAWTRAEASSAVADYIELISSKNQTKVGWMAEALTNQSLPINFTIGVLRELAVSLDDPNKLTTGMSGKFLVAKMMQQNSSVVQQALLLMTDADFWASEGFDLDNQMVVVDRVTQWAGESSVEDVSISAVYNLTQNSSAVTSRADKVAMTEKVTKLKSQMKTRVENSQNAKAAKARRARSVRVQGLVASTTSMRLFEDLLGASPALFGSEEPMATEVVNAGQPASEETLQFVAWLGYNASQTAARFQTDAFIVGSGTGQTMNNWAGKIGKMDDMVYSFAQTTMQLATPSGIQEMQTTLQNFLDEALDEVLNVVQQVETNSSSCIKLGGVWSKLKSFLGKMKPVLPVAVKSLKYTRKGVDVVADQFENTFSMLVEQDVPFHVIADIVVEMCHLYHAITCALTTAMLLLNLWAAGVIKWPTRYVIKEPERDEDGYVAPTTFRERLAACKTSCLVCLTTDPVELPIVFWSFLILLDLIVLVLFWVCIAYCALLGFAFFLHIGCKQIYPIEDLSVCHDVMTMYGGFMSKLDPTFYQDENVCGVASLATCNFFKREVESQMFYIVICGFCASFFSYQLLVDSAVLHEQARWNIALNKLQRKDE
jgi:hypothetical protein